MSKNNKHLVKDKKMSQEKKEKKKNLIISLFILAIMVLSVVGFAMMSGGGSGTNNNGTPNEIPFQQFQDPETGIIFWGAIRNSEQFIFENIDGFEAKIEEKELANKLKEKESVNIYINQGFNSSETIILIEKGLRGIKTPFNVVNQFECNPNTLILTNEEDEKFNNCMVFLSTNEEAYNKTNYLLYHLIQ
ncbi:MAG: hypothetical protein KC589_04885 [Nanoarchaeota archaeon]|nr:hypothetical protein [Nanoarchaeota archaeon]